VAELALSLALLALLVFLAWREKAWSAERASLLLRIQAPKVAIAQQTERPRGRPAKVVPVNDDKAYAAAQERREGLNGDGD